MPVGQAGGGRETEGLRTPLLQPAPPPPRACCLDRCRPHAHGPPTQDGPPTRTQSMRTKQCTRSVHCQGGPSQGRQLHHSQSALPDSRLAKGPSLSAGTRLLFGGSMFLSDTRDPLLHPLPGRTASLCHGPTPSITHAEQNPPCERECVRVCVWGWNGQEALLGIEREL